MQMNANNVFKVACGSASAMNSILCVCVCMLPRWKMANNRNEWWRERSPKLDIVYFVARVVNLTAAPSLSSGLYITNTHSSSSTQTQTHIHRQERQAAKVGEMKKKKNAAKKKKLRLQLGVVVIPFACTLPSSNNNIFTLPLTWLQPNLLLPS